MAADGSAGDTGRAERLRALIAEADAAEAEAAEALSDDDAKEIEQIERREAAREKLRVTLLSKKRAEAVQRAAEFRKAANGAYVVEVLDLEEESPGAGLYVIKSPTKESWKEFRKRVDTSNGDDDKVMAAYNNLAAISILWPPHPGDAEWTALKAKFPVLVQSIGDAVGGLGGIAAKNRKR